MRRWLIRIFLLLLVLGSAACAAVQGILWSDLPRRRMLSSLERELGLRVQAESLSVGWFGQSTLRQVRLALPLSDDPLLDVPVAGLSHTSVPVLLFGGRFEIDSLTLRDATLSARQDAQGRWNVQEALQLASGPAASEAHARTDQPPDLPTIIIEATTVDLVDNTGRAARLTPVSFAGRPADQLVWSYSADVAGLARLDGELAPGRTWAHRVRFVTQDLSALLRPWLGLIAPLHAAGQWEGEIGDDALTGRLQLDSACILGVALSGAAGLAVVDGELAIRPDDLVVHTGIAFPAEAALTAGWVRVGSQRLGLDSVHLLLLEGAASISGQWDWSSSTGNLSARWNGLKGQGGMRHSGGGDFSVVRPTAGQLHAEATIDAEAEGPYGRWEGRLSIEGGGESWSATDWEVAIQRLSWDTADRSHRGEPLTAQLSMRDRRISLRRLSLEGTGRLSGQGSYDLAGGEWWLHVAADGLPLPGLVDRTGEFSFNASGSRQWIDVPRAHFTTGAFRAEAGGHYDPSSLPPVKAWFAVHRPGIQAGPQQQTYLASGSLHGWASAQGTVQPLRLALNGQLGGIDLRFGKRALGDVLAQVTGHLTAEELLLRTTQLDLLEGHWRLAGRYDLQRELASLSVDVSDLSLRQADALVDPPPTVEGNLSAVVEVDVPGWRIEQGVARAQWEVIGLRKGPLTADRAHGRASFDGDLLDLDEIHLSRADGQADGSVRYRVGSRQWEAKAAIDAWPFDISAVNGTVRLSGQVGISSGPDVGFDGKVDLVADVAIDQTPTATVRAAGQLDGRTLRLSSLQAEAAGGLLEGSASVPLDDPLATAAVLQWNDLDLGRVASTFPAAGSASGRLSGMLEAAPTTNPYALGLMRLHMRVDPTAAKVRGVDLGPAVLAGFLDHDRLVMGTSEVQVAGGTVRPWLRVTRRPDEERFVHLDLAAEDLDLDQLVHAAKPDADPMPGRVGGRLTIFGPSANHSSWNGSGSIQLTNSDLVNSDIVNMLYALLNVGRGGRTLGGYGSASFRLEGERLEIPRMRYFNRGVAVRSSVTLANIWQGTESPIAGQALGSARPLGSLKLPLIPQINDVVDALQEGAVTVEISGTVGYPKTRVVPLPAINDALRVLLMGDVRDERRAKKR